MLYIYTVMESMNRPFEVLGPIFKDDFDLIVNVDKTENTRLGHKDMDVNQDEWRYTRKVLGTRSRRGIEELQDVNKRIFNLHSLPFIN